MNNEMQKCDVTCNFQFSYGTSSCVVTPNGNFLSYQYDGQSIVTYNSTDIGSKYNVQEIRVYSPPLTNYTGNSTSNEAKAEIFIHHVNPETGKNLLVCVPVALNDSSSKSSELLEQIISPSIENDGSTQSINVSNFTLNSVIPITEYYQYNSNLPYSPTGNNVCSNVNADIIVFPANGNINMNTSTYNTLTSLVTGSASTDTQTPENVGLRFNEKGTMQNSSTGDDDIYIECNPIGEDGSDIGGSTDGELGSSLNVPNKKKYLSDETTQKVINVMLYLFVAIIIGIIIYYSYKFLNKWMSNLAAETPNPISDVASAVSASAT
jgi:hypothetical protein